MSKIERQFKIGEVYWIDFIGNKSVQRGKRPGLIIQNNTGNMFSPNVIAVPLTTVIKKKEQPTHVFIPSNETGLKKDSIVLCENPQSIPKTEVGDYITILPDNYMSKIAEANILSTSVISYLNPDNLLTLWKQAVCLNNNYIVA